MTKTTTDQIGHPDPNVWIKACELAKARHPNAPYPQPKDIEDAENVQAN